MSLISLPVCSSMCFQLIIKCVSKLSSFDLNLSIIPAYLSKYIISIYLYVCICIKVSLFSFFFIPMNQIFHLPFLYIIKSNSMSINLYIYLLSWDFVCELPFTFFLFLASIACTPLSPLFVFSYLMRHLPHSRLRYFTVLSW